VFILNLSVAVRVLLIISIVLQSLSSIASATYDSHQVDVEHLQTQHDHKNDPNIIKENAGDSQHEIKDSHHCGHCSGSHLSWILVSNLNSTAKLHFINRFSPQVDQTKDYQDSILRPPKS
jgi:hypothetical protein